MDQEKSRRNLKKIKGECEVMLGVEQNSGEYKYNENALCKRPGSSVM